MAVDHFPLMVVGTCAPQGQREVRSPFDDALIATVDTAGAETVEQALTAAQALYRNRDKWLSPARRIEILSNTARLMQERRDHLALEAAREGGKPLMDSIVEVDRAIDGVLNCADMLRSHTGEVVPMNINAASKDRIAFTRNEPIGVVVAVSAFNHPLNLIVHQAGPAIAAGCPVIVKPADDTPLSCFRFVELLRESGLPADWCQAFITDNTKVATELVTDQRVDFFSFIGSAAVGWMLRSRLAPGARCALEHGGVAPAIVAADADLDAALPKLAKGGFYHAGQVCVSVQRVFAHRSLVETVAAGLSDLAARLRVGDPVLPDTEVGPLIRAKELARVDQWVKEAVDAGARLVCGGKALSQSCYAPTVLVEPPAECKVSTQEVFGPVICVYAYDDLDEAIERANALPYAFQSAIFTRDLDTANHAYAHLDASAVMVNDHTAFRVDWMPFAGLRQSGLGVGGIPYTFRDMQIQKLWVGPMH